MHDEPGTALQAQRTYTPFSLPCCCFQNNQCAERPVSDDYIAINVSNGVLGATLGLSGTIQWNTGCFPMTNTPCITLQAEGSIQLGTTGGTNLLRDSGIAMTSGYPWAVFPGGIYISMQERRNNQTRTFVWGRSQGAPNVTFDRAWPGASGVYIRRQWYVEGWQTDMRIELIQSVARIELRVRNSGTEPASLALCLRIRCGGRGGGGCRSERRLTATLCLCAWSAPYSGGHRFAGLQVPPAVEFYHARGDLFGASRYILRPTAGFEDATPIDRLVFGELVLVRPCQDDSRLWEPVLFPDAFIRDVAINLFVNPRNFAPGQERVFVFYVTLTPVSLDVQPPIAVGVETLPVIEPDQRNLAQLANGGVFEVIASITNMFHVVNKEVDLRNVTVDLSLPGGITLAPGESRTKTISIIRPEATSAVRWRVVADPRAVGFATIRVSVNAPPAPPKTVSRTILISATANRELKRGFQIISIPFNTTAPLVDVLGLPEGTYLAKRWNPTREVYETVDTLQPGIGFWLYLPNEGTNITMSNLTFPQSVFTQSTPIRLSRGWNQIGNPYPYPLILGQIVVVSASDPRNSLSFFEAAQRGVIRGVLYYWDEFSGEYKFTSDPNTPLIPHRGYWIKCNDDIELVFPPVFIPGAGFGGHPRTLATEQPNRPSEWRLQLIARTARGEDTQNYIGISAGRSAGEVEEPPTPLAEVPVRLTLLKPGTNTPLMQDVRPASATRHTFELLVEAPAGEEVSLRAPNVRTVPASYRLRLTDQSTGRTVDLRHTPEYRFTSSGRNRFTLTVERGARGGALITSINIGTAGRGANSVSISYVLAQDAQTEVTILGADGRVIANLQRGRAATRGVNTVVWNLRDNEGRTVPPGTYRVQIEARDSEGQVARAVRPLLITR
jgi:hypothetical protein